MIRPTRSLCAHCMALIADSDPTLIIDIFRTSHEPPQRLDIEPENRWRFVQSLAADPFEVLNYGVVLHGVELPLLSVAKLNGTQMCAVHLGAYASIASSKEANR